MNDTLVLDMNWQPVGFTTWQNAVKLVWEERAQVVKEDEAGRILRSPSFSMGMPRVIVVRNAWTKRRRQAVPFSRRNIAVRDNSECQYTGRWEENGGSRYWVPCGEILHTHQYTLDHVIPRSQGGVSSWTNLVLACVACNKAKAGRTPQQARMQLRSKPTEPSTSDPKYNFKLHIKNVRNEWREYADWLYWNLVLDK